MGKAEMAGVCHGVLTRPQTQQGVMGNSSSFGPKSPGQASSAFEVLSLLITSNKVHQAGAEEVAGASAALIPSL